MNPEKKPMEQLGLLVDFNKSEILEFENIEKLRTILKIVGNIHEDDLNLLNEKYDSEKKNI